MVMVSAAGSLVSSSDIYSLIRYQAINGEHYIDLHTTRELNRGDIVSVTSAVDGITREYVVWEKKEPHTQDLIIREYRCIWLLQAVLTVVTSSTMPGTSGSLATATQALEALLTDTEVFEIGTVEPTTTAGASFWRMSAWEALSVLIDKWGGEVQTRHEAGARYIDLLDALGEQSRFVYKYGTRDVESITAEEKDAPEVCRVLPLGAAEASDTWGYGRKIDITSVNDGIPYLQDDLKAAEMADALQPTATAYIENANAKSPQELKDWALSVIHEYTRPAPDYTVKLATIYADTVAYIPTLGDSGTVIDDELGLELVCRVQSVKVDELARTIDATLSTQRLQPGSFAQLLGLNKTGDTIRTWGLLKNYTWGSLVRSV